MDALTLVLYLESPETIPEDVTEEDILTAIREHSMALRQLQGSYGRMLEQLECEGLI